MRYIDGVELFANCYTYGVKRIFLGLLVFTPLALLAAYLKLSPILAFLLSAVAIIPLAKYIGDATEELSAHAGPGLGGFLNATFGNATELIVGIFALNAGLFEVVKATIVGSILGNLLLVLGTAIFFGGMKRERQKFNATAAKAAVSMLLLATIALVITAVFAATSPSAGGTAALYLSIVVSVLMIFAYCAHLVFTLRTHTHLYQHEAHEEVKLLAPRWRTRTSIIVLATATIAVALVSDALVNAITPLVTQFGWTELFIGAVFVAIIGNVAEHSSAIQAAVKNKIGLAFSISIGSATQIALFVAPVLVLLSLFMAKPMSLVFNSFELIALVFAIFLTNSVIEDGETNWLEGLQLVVAYVILTVAFFLHV
jgi:Ca2+:H+ antiporter